MFAHRIALRIGHGGIWHISNSECRRQQTADRRPQNSLGALSASLLLRGARKVPNISASWPGSRVWRGLAPRTCLQTRLGRLGRWGLNSRRRQRAPPRQQAKFVRDAACRQSVLAVQVTHFHGLSCDGQKQSYCFGSNVCIRSLGTVNSAHLTTRPPPCLREKLALTLWLVAPPSMNQGTHEPSAHAMGFP